VGCTSDEIGQRVAVSWELPENLRPCLLDRDPELAPSDIRSIITIVNSGSELTDQIYGRGRPLDMVRLRPIYDARGVRVSLSQQHLIEVVTTAAEETTDMCSTLGLPLENLRFEQQIQSCRSILNSAQIFSAETLSRLDKAIGDAQRNLKQADFDPGRIITALLGAIQKVGFERVVFGLVNEDRTVLSGRIASARNETEILEAFQFPVDKTDGPLLAAMHTRIDVLVNCDRDTRYNDSTLVERLNPKSFVLFPIVIDRYVIGCLYADRQYYTSGLERIQGPLGRVRETIAAALRLGSCQGSGMQVIMKAHERGKGSAVAGSGDRGAAQCR
jgi:hypothetical protein